ncbi:ribosome maturation factor RimP [Senegalia massiliensis]|uniref:Ribosome maturation factor RimP n=1 Tax=Senegalia massiliensis TaxID=1720316 RepID=A0A845R1N1_9CLOT|nr:ribosome maturation factor RimP [Senegalia massiliensis]NBI07899.1 ribosome maturation factor RimP [Senegalia massiliensis]
MNKKEVEKQVYNIIYPISQEMDFELVDLEYVKEGPYKYLRVFIDKPGGVSIDDCQNFSKNISEKVDEQDPIKENYFLEVSSPGIDRPFKDDKDFKRALNKEVEVNLYKKINNSKTFVGELIDFDENIIIINNNKEDIKINRTDIAKINIAIKF